MNKCYLCGNEFNEQNVKKHDEHVIQQAVGGNLTENDILCFSCGENLGNEVDVPFNKIFEGISTRLDIKTDRKTNKKGIKGKMGDLDVIWKDFKVYPSTPFHLYSIDKTSVIIYANLETAKQYKKKVEKEIKDNFEEDKKPSLIICDDLKGLVEFPFQMNNKDFKKGLAKIAIGFASKYKINREYLPLVLEINENTKKGKIKDNIIALQFYPLGIIDRLIEIQKDKFAHYPFHNLILFTLDYDPNTSKGKKVLICYIELFSTFQYYLILNDEYYGYSIYEYYAQNILKKDDYKVEIGRRYYKERDIWLQPLGITDEYIEKKYNNRDDKNKTRWNIEEEIIQEETIKQKYKFDFEDYVENILKSIMNKVLISKDSNKEQLKDSYFSKFINNDYIMKEYKVFENFDEFMNFKENLDLFFSQKYNEEHDDYDEVFYILSYRRFFYHTNIRNYYTELLENFEILKKSEAFKKYGHNKFYMLENYIQNKIVTHKIGGK